MYRQRKNKPKNKPKKKGKVKYVQVFKQPLTLIEVPITMSDANAIAHWEKNTKDYTIIAKGGK